jgi:hypothetical protein
VRCEILTEADQDPEPTVCLELTRSLAHAAAVAEAVRLLHTTRPVPAGT